MSEFFRSFRRSIIDSLTDWSRKRFIEESHTSLECLGEGFYSCFRAFQVGKEEKDEDFDIFVDDRRRPKPACLIFYSEYFKFYNIKIIFLKN